MIKDNVIVNPTFSLKYQKLTTRQYFYIAKALKVKYNIPITKTLYNVNFAEFYGSMPYNVSCDKEVLEYLFELIGELGEEADKLLEKGKKIVLEEERLKQLNWPQIISNLKTIFKATNKELDKMTGCNHKGIGEWERNSRTPSYYNYKLLLDFMNKNYLSPEYLSRLNGIKHTYKDRYTKLKPMKIDRELSEFIGILNGDGTITKSGEIKITGNSIEDFMHHKSRIKKLAKDLFDKEVTQRVLNSIVVSSFGSMRLSKQFEKIGLPIGKKINLRISKYILSQDELIKSYLRGLLDTDGTICSRNKNNARIGYGSFNEENFTRDVFVALRKLGFNPQFMSYNGRSRVEIIRDIEVIKFFRDIGSCNYSKIARFIYWRINKILPGYNYPTFKENLKDYRIDIETIKIPFIWDYKYFYILDNEFKNILLPLFKEDQTRLKLYNIRSQVDWKVKISLLKERFGLSILTEEFNTNHKVIWQWQVGMRIPSLDNFILINNFCNKNDIKLF